MFDNGSPLKYIFSLFVLALAIFVGSYLARLNFLKPEAATLSAPPPVEISGVMLEYERNTIGVFQEASPAVVFVHNLQYVRNFFSMRVTEEQQGTGSGFLWDEEGHIVTNWHVVQGASRVAVTLIDGKTYEAELVGREPRKDLAVLKIELRDTNVTPFSKKVADSDKLLVGQKAIAIGNPYGLDYTLTVGNVSALGRSTPAIETGITIRDMIQTDAPINPGNSGGPLLDSRGFLIGMNTLILRNSNGIGFAVPSNTINRIVGQIIEHGRPLQSGIGISIFEDRIARAYGIEGVIVWEVYPNTPAAQAGMAGTRRDRFGRIVFGDVILSIDGERIRSKDDLYNAFYDKQPGEDIDIVYLHQGEEKRDSIEIITITE